MLVLLLLPPQPLQLLLYTHYTPFERFLNIKKSNSRSILWENNSKVSLPFYKKICQPTIFYTTILPMWKTGKILLDLFSVYFSNSYFNFNFGLAAFCVADKIWTKFWTFANSLHWFWFAEKELERAAKTVQLINKKCTLLFLYNGLKPYYGTK